MKEILCFGDSNTWGWNPATQSRFPREERWTGVLQRELGDECHVIEEGLNGRTTVWDDPIEGYKNGKERLIPCLESHKPLDLVIIMLGTNDLKTRFSVTAFDIAAGAGTLVDIVQRSQTGRNNSAPKVLLIAPPPLGKLSDFAEMFTGAREKSLRFSQRFREVSEELGCHFFDSSEVVTTSDIDGVHWEGSSHEAFGKRVASVVREILG